MAALLPVLLATAATLSLTASEFTGGAQAGPAMPLGDMRPLTDRRPGLTVALFGLWEYDEGLAWRLRADQTAASGRPLSIPGASGQVQLDGRTRIGARSTSLGVDYLFYLEGRRDRGIYLGVGPELVQNRVTLEDPGRIDGAYSQLALGLNVSAGYQLNRHWQVELSGRTSRFSRSIMAEEFTYSMTAVTLAIGYLF